MISHPTRVAGIIPTLLLLTISFLISACLDPKNEDEVELTLSKLPAGVDSLNITLVNFNDTGIVYETLWANTALPRTPFLARLGSAQGKNWLAKVKGYQNSLLVYHVVIPSDPSNLPLQLEVRSGWPAVFFTSATLDTTGSPDSIKFMTDFRLLPAGSHWHLNYSPIQYDIAYASWLNVATTNPNLQKGKFVTADLHVNGTHALVPVQEPDTILVDEALSPSGSKVRISEAYTDTSNMVHLMLALEKFKLPSLDSAIPGEGIPMLHDKRGLRLIPGFHHVPGDVSQLVGPADDLIGIDTIVVALHYAVGIRIRPPIQDALPVANALRSRSVIPTLSVTSFKISAADTSMLLLTLARTNFSGLHAHIYRNAFGDAQYQICEVDECSVSERVWKGAKTLVVAAHFSGTHNPVIPLVMASVALP
jgi:hypothetical protein